MVFWLFRKIEGRLAVTYILAQLTGAIIGCLPLLIWGQMGRSIDFGVTIPGEGFTKYTVLWGEVITTFTMVSLLVIFIGFRQVIIKAHRICNFKSRMLFSLVIYNFQDLRFAHRATLPSSCI